MHGKARREMWTGKCRWKADLDVEADRSVLFEVIEYLIAWRCDFNANLTYVDYDPILVALAVRETIRENQKLMLDQNQLRKVLPGK